MEFIPVALNLVFFKVLHESAAGPVNDALGFACCPARVHDEQRVIERQLLVSNHVPVGVGSSQVEEV